MPRKDANAAPANAQAQQEAASDGIENYELPKSLVTRIAKSAVRRENVSFAIERDVDGLYWVFFIIYRVSSVCMPAQIPDNAKLQKDTVLALVKGSTVFINFLGTSDRYIYNW